MNIEIESLEDQINKNVEINEITEKRVNIKIIL
jgi:hypothetical protein